MRRILWLLCPVWLLACAPQEQAYQQTIAPASMNGSVYQAADGELLAMRHWSPAKSKPKAVIIALHGFNDYSRAFIALGNYMQKRGIATYAYDQRGFGENTQRGIWAGEDNLTRDLATFTALVRAKHPNTPIYLLGESMGASVVMLAATHADMPPVSGLILVSPAVWGSDAMPITYRALLWLAAHTVPEHQMTGRDLKILATNNIPVLRRMSDDPNIIKATRIDAIYGISHLMGNAYEAASTLPPPILLMYGGNDQVIPPEPVISVVKRLPKPFTIGYYEEGYHMLTRDIEREALYADMIGWMRTK